VRPALFLDRDGVINEEVSYLGDPGRLIMITGVAAAIARVNRAGLPVIVITNQAGIARGYYSIDDLDAVTRRLDELLAAEGARVDATYFCPHHPEAPLAEYRQECECRKPRAGLLQRAAAEHGLDLSRSVLVGDKASDLGAARAAGCAAVLVRTGYGAEHERQVTADAVFDDLAAAVPWILGATRSREGG
jgi:D-glycero-D-manno-heptose 1,7-bisphosphate phosphatase